MNASITPELLEAYRCTRYRVDVSPPFELRIDALSGPLAALMARHHATSAVFITAWNPCSAPHSDEENERAQARLLAELKGMRLAIVPGFGEWEHDASKGEPSFLVLGLDEARARELGSRYRQHAILCAGADAIPRLVLLSPTA